MDNAQLIAVLASIVLQASPLIIAVCGEILTERSGVVNLSLDGTMLMAAMLAFVVGMKTQNVWLGFAAAAAIGALFALIIAFGSIRLGQSQVAIGFVLTLLGDDLSAFLGQNYTRMRGVIVPHYGIPVLKDIPVIGPLLFDQSPMVYLTLLLVVFTSIFFNRTRAGLSYKSVGEHPQAAATLGINVIGVKYLACMICGALAGLGGAYLTTCYSSTYTDGIVAGRGFIALAAVIFGRWSAGGILLACLFFGFCDALQIRLQVSGIAIPYQFFQMIPYVATVVVLSVIGTKQAGPKANGQPYRREQR